MPDRSHDEDPLRAAMERVRGTAKPPTRPTPAASEAANVVPLQPRRRPRFDVRGRVSDVLSRVEEPAAAVWPAPIAGLISGVWATAMSLFALSLVVIIGWVFAPLGSGQFGDVLRASTGVWLLADGGAFRWQGATLSLTPLVATFGVLVFQRRAGRWLARAVAAERARDVLVPLAYATAAAVSMHLVLAALVSSDTLIVAYGRNAVGAALVAIAGFGWGLQVELKPSLPHWLAEAIRLARLYLAIEVGCAVAVVLMLLITQRGPFFDVLRAVAGDTTSTLQVLLLCILFVPTIVLWVVAVFVGGVVAIGTGTSVTLSASVLGALPPFPLLALLPNTMPAWAHVFLVSAPAAAVLGLMIGKPSRSPRTRAAAVAVVTVVAAVVGAAASGGIGPGRLTQVGVQPITFTFELAAWLALILVADEVLIRVRAALASARTPAPIDSSPEPTIAP